MLILSVEEKVAVFVAALVSQSFFVVPRLFPTFLASLVVASRCEGSLLNTLLTTLHLATVGRGTRYRGTAAGEWAVLNHSRHSAGQFVCVLCGAAGLPLGAAAHGQKSKHTYPLGGT